MMNTHRNVVKVTIIRSLRTLIRAKVNARSEEEFKRCFLYVITKEFSGGNREGEIPDPIPNSEVKPLIADGNHARVWESRSPPGFN